MKSLIILKSEHHGNTLRVARILSRELDAEIRDPKEIDPEFALGFDHLTFGSGIYFWTMHEELLNFAERLPKVDGKLASIFSTAGMPSLKRHEKLRNILFEKGFHILGELSLPGWDTFGILKLIGGIKRGRPNEQDLNKAQEFARSLKEKK
jgi:flavodoxin